MKQIIFTAILIFVFFFAPFTYAETFSLNSALIKLDQYVMFDEYQNLTTKDEKVRLDNLFRKISVDETLKSLIILKLDKNAPRKKKIKRLKAISKHFNARKVNKARFSFAVFND